MGEKTIVALHLIPISFNFRDEAIKDVANNANQNKSEKKKRRGSVLLHENFDDADQAHSSQDKNDSGLDDQLGALQSGIDRASRAKVAATMAYFSRKSAVRPSTLPPIFV